MAHAFGVPESSIKEASLTFKGVVHRLEYVGEIDDVKYINNSMCTNNAAFASSLEAITAPKIVIAGGVFKGGDMTPIANAISNNNVKLLVTFGRSGPVIADVVRSNSDVKVAVTPDLQSALAVSSSEAVVGDTIILNPGCASFDQFKDFEHRGDTFKSIVLALRKVTSK